ncbi:putative ATPase/DNA-binding CsgD family transcriptional regulator/Tfp pilus assembly protein PilF [Lipingzhangella halophila]|uniref:Putative ATPase/DNA-binding CsgD family transcriptional regulator/Tfp pilus assembly protein PilF n=1 Tax=Lipingzhangella halophila TaxID=1783352 RepID=A0A7W7W541_9ACTN|nr:LuxR C-terminal-related transcriptional regulator [Lipingzhangella halophila]MBB4933479.1 putative ATPase/DNA-binding CsgD family transcriptional regulator/Tfp pilus assembly protein PilF [Lipingzhangella halophila]
MSPPPHNLPSPADDFIGRERDVSDICQLLGNLGLVSLTGTGGIGKTRLAVNVAERLMHRIDDGARFVDLSDATTTEQVGRTVARALRVMENPDRAATDAIITALRPQHVLLVLDTCERAVEPIAELCREILEHCPNVRILATTRQPLRVAGECVWRVPPLSMPVRPTPTEARGGALVPLPRRDALRYEAVRLFINRAHAARTGFQLTRENAGHVVEICRMLDGVPLAIELAAARVRVLSAEQILHRLDDRFRLLATNDRELPARQRTMRGVLEWSHALLTERERVLFRRLSVFSAWDLDLAEDVCNGAPIGDTEVPELHSSLLDKSLVVVDAEADGTVYYRLPDTVRAYAAERLAASGEQEALWDRYLRSTVTRLEAAEDAACAPLPWAERKRLLHRQDHFRENTERLLSWALDHGRIEGGLRVSAALRSYWIVRDLVIEGTAYLRKLLGTDADAQPSAVRTRALAVYAELALSVEAPHTVSAAARQALDAAHRTNDPGAAGNALLTLAIVAERTGDDLEAGQRHANEALDLAVRLPAHITEIGALRVLAHLAARRGGICESERLLERAIAVSERIGDRWNEARCLNTLGMTALRRGDLDTASGRLNKALQVFDELGVAPETARCTAGLGHVDVARGDIASARERLAECLRMSVRSGRRIAVARGLEALAELAITEGQMERAASLTGAASSLRSALGQPWAREGKLFSRIEQDLSRDTAIKAWEMWRTLPLGQVIENALAFPAPRRPPAPVLTRREKEIAALVGAGLTNRQIAENLIISQATAARHIANIFRKMALSSRAQLAEWARRHGLT